MAKKFTYADLKKRTKRTLLFKCDAYLLYANGLTPKQAFTEAAEIHEVSICKCMMFFSSSYMSDDIKNFLRKKIAQGNEEVLAYFSHNNLDLNF